MKRWLVLIGILNLAVIFLSMAPLLVTFAETPPKDIIYNVCDENSVKAALSLARSGGIEFMRNFVSSTIYLLIAGIVANFLVLLFFKKRSS